MIKCVHVQNVRRPVGNRLIESQISVKEEPMIMSISRLRVDIYACSGEVIKSAEFWISRFPVAFGSGCTCM